MNSIFKKISLSVAALVLLCVIVLSLSIRGVPGNPNSTELVSDKWRDSGPLELSPERGRFALLYSVIEDKTVFFSVPIARFATPDLGYFNKKYVSLFAPGVSYFAIPGYLIGKYFGASQVGAFATAALFAILNVLLIRAIALMIGANKTAATIAALAFLFATPAFTYAVTLYQHHISTFLILFSLYCLLRWNNAWSLSLVWLMIATSVVVDYPNLILMIPVGLFALNRVINFESNADGYKINFQFWRVLTVLVVILPIGFFLWFNKTSYGSPFRLSGTVPSVEYIDAAGNPAKPPAVEGIVNINPKNPNREKTALGFFKTRNMLNGFYIHTVSPDRGVIFYAPIALLGLIGFFYMRKRHMTVFKILLATVGFDILLYSMWGDPQGGWAFGSRYLIPSYAVLSIGNAYLLTRFKKNYFAIFLFFGILVYSVSVNALGAITTSKNPPRTEILELEKISKQEEKYTYARNWQYLEQNKSRSFVYQTMGNKVLTAKQYYWMLLAIIIASFGFMLTMLILDKSERMKE